MKKIKYKKGFTLVEILVAMAIISIVSMGFYTMINSSIKHNVKNEIDIQSLNMAQSEIENLRNQIKSSKGDLKIYDIENNVIEISKDSISESDIYAIKYDKDLDNNHTKYEINLELTRKEKADKYLYNIKIFTSEKDKKLSKKITKLETNVLSK